MKILSVFFLLLSSLAGKEAIPSREWTSTVGTKIQAKATEVKNETVTLVTAEGRTLRIPLSKLSEEDQTLLSEHFRAEAPGAPTLEPPTLDHPLGEVVGPIESGEDGSSYFLYLPTTLKAEMDAPLFFYTGANKAKKTTLDAYIAGAELCGIVLAASVESKNQSSAFTINHGHTVNCLKHIKKTLPVEIERVFFTGPSGGGASAFYNASKLKCLGALPYIGYIPAGSTPNKKGFYYIATGTWDFNRYSSASAAKKFKNRATHRLYPGGHSGSSREVCLEGMIWLYTRHIFEKRSKLEDEAIQFEARFSTYLDTLKESSSELAYFWTDHLLNTCEIEGSYAQYIKQLHRELEKEPKNVKYLAGRVALDDFSEKYYAPVYSGASLFEHSTPAIKSAAEVLIQEYQGVVEVEEIAQELGKETPKPPK